MILSFEVAPPNSPIAVERRLKYLGSFAGVECYATSDGLEPGRAIFFPSERQIGVDPMPYAVMSEETFEACEKTQLVDLLRRLLREYEL